MKRFFSLASVLCLSALLGSTFAFANDDLNYSSVEEDSISWNDGSESGLRDHGRRDRWDRWDRGDRWEFLGCFEHQRYCRRSATRHYHYYDARLGDPRCQHTGNAWGCYGKLRRRR